MMDEISELLPAGWELEDPHGGLELVCPHGHTIEPDGRCPDGCISPLRSLGLIWAGPAANPWAAGTRSAVRAGERSLLASGQYLPPRHPMRGAAGADSGVNRQGPRVGSHYQPRGLTIPTIAAEHAALEDF